MRDLWQSRKTIIVIQVTPLMVMLVVDMMAPLAVQIAVNHRFGSCSKKNDLDSRYLFQQELWAHVLSTRKRANEPIRPFLLHSNPTGKSDVTANTNNIHINTPHSSRKRTDMDKLA